jgi:hypothetical protein
MARGDGDGTEVDRSLFSLGASQGSLALIRYGSGVLVKGRAVVGGMTTRTTTGVTDERTSVVGSKGSIAGGQATSHDDVLRAGGASAGGKRAEARDGVGRRAT